MQPEDKKENKHPFEVDSKKYHQFFQRNPDGAAILTELSMLFYDRTSVVSGDPYGTHVKEGERNVVKFIIDKCAQGGE